MTDYFIDAKEYYLLTEMTALRYFWKLREANLAIDSLINPCKQQYRLFNFLKYSFPGPYLTFSIWTLAHFTDSDRYEINATYWNLAEFSYSIFCLGIDTAISTIDTVCKIFFRKCSNQCVSHSSMKETFMYPRFCCTSIPISSVISVLRKESWRIFFSAAYIPMRPLTCNVSKRTWY